MRRELLCFGLILMSTMSFGQWTTPFISTGVILQVDIEFLTANEGFVVGANAFPNGNATIARTTDGGASWSTVYSLPPAITPSFLTLNKIQFVNSNLAYACGGYADPVRGILCKSVNGGLSWDTVSHNLNVTKFLSLHFFDADNGLMASSDIWRTTDGGLTWTAVTLPVGAPQYKELYFFNSSLGFALGNVSSVMLRTTDGGMSWSAIVLPTTEDVYDVHFSSATTGILVCGSGVILKTSDGGMTWTQVINNDPGQNDVTCVQMTTASSGFAGVLNGKILNTVDGGNTWNENFDASIGPPANLLAIISTIDFPSTSVGYAGGHLLTLLAKTDNAGGVNSIGENQADQWSAFPNPTDGLLHLNSAHDFFGDNATLSIFSSDGKLCREELLSNAQEVLDISELEAGMYLFRIVGNGTTQSFSISKQ